MDNRPGVAETSIFTDRTGADLGQINPELPLRDQLLTQTAIMAIKTVETYVLQTNQRTN
jgi:hypothetical protein